MACLTVFTLVFHWSVLTTSILGIVTLASALASFPLGDSSRNPTIPSGHPVCPRSHFGYAFQKSSIEGAFREGQERDSTAVDSLQRLALAYALGWGAHIDVPLDFSC